MSLKTEICSFLILPSTMSNPCTFVLVLFHEQEISANFNVTPLIKASSFYNVSADLLIHKPSLHCFVCSREVFGEDLFIGQSVAM